MTICKNNGSRFEGSAKIFLAQSLISEKKNFFNGNDKNNKAYYV